MGSIAFSDTDIKLQLCLPYLGYVSLPSYILVTAIINYEIEFKDKKVKSPDDICKSFAEKYPSYL